MEFPKSQCRCKTTQIRCRVNCQGISAEYSDLDVRFRQFICSFLRWGHEDFSLGTLSVQLFASTMEPRMLLAWSPISSVVCFYNGATNASHLEPYQLFVSVVQLEAYHLFSWNPFSCLVGTLSVVRFSCSVGTLSVVRFYKLLNVGTISVGRFSCSAGTLSAAQLEPYQLFSWNPIRFIRLCFPALWRASS